MHLHRHNPEIVEPAFGFVGAVADDEMVAAQGLVVEIVPIWGMVIGRNRVANGNGMVVVADADGAVAKVVIKRHAEGFLVESRHEVGAAHVAIAQRAFDVDFVLVVRHDLFAARPSQNRQHDKAENDS